MFLKKKNQNNCVKIELTSNKRVYNEIQMIMTFAKYFTYLSNYFFTYFNNTLHSFKSHWRRLWFMFLISFRLSNKLVLIKGNIRHNTFQMYSYKNNFKKIFFSHKDLIIILRNDLEEEFFYLLIEIGDFFIYMYNTQNGW